MTCLFCGPQEAKFMPDGDADNLGFVSIKDCSHNPIAMGPKQAVMEGGYFVVATSEGEHVQKTNFASVVASSSDALVWWECCVLLPAGGSIKDNLGRLGRYCAVPKEAVS